MSKITILPFRHVTIDGALRGPRTVVDVPPTDAATLVAEGYAVAGEVEIPDERIATTPEEPLPPAGERAGRKLDGKSRRRRSTVDGPED